MYKSCTVSVVQAVAQLPPLLQGSHGQAQVLLQVLDLSLALDSQPAQLHVDLRVSFTCQSFLLQIRKWQTCLKQWNIAKRLDDICQMFPGFKTMRINIPWYLIKNVSFTEQLLMLKFKYCTMLRNCSSFLKQLISLCKYSISFSFILRRT